jgi:hypothetical protein
MPGKKQDAHVERADHWSEANNRLNDAGHFISEIAFSLEEAGPEGGVVACQWQDCLVELEQLQAKMSRLAR